ncbi:MAG: hypothetical protein ABL908_14220 [Hyphomicrobium sp.]
MFLALRMPDLHPQDSCWALRMPDLHPQDSCWALQMPTRIRADTVRLTLELVPDSLTIANRNLRGL